MRRLIFSALLATSCQLSLAQSNDINGPINTPAPGVLDGVYIQEHIPTKKPLVYESVSERDVMWSKRVWRAIDLRQKMNHTLYYPLDDIQPGDEMVGEWNWKKNSTRWSLWTVLLHFILKGDITMYSPYNPDWVDWKDGDQFKYPITAEQYGSSIKGNFYTDSVYRDFIKEGYFGYTDFFSPRVVVKCVLDPTIDSMNTRGEVVYYPREYFWYKSEDIVQYHIKEDWFFDKERSIVEPRIIGIAPCVYEKDPDGNIIGMKELFWVYYPQAKYKLQNFFVQNRHNDAQRMSFDDLFQKRMFQSYVIKESNIYDRFINEYNAGQEALLESERIEEKISNMEHNLWSF
ncbi:gliding motility protein GldN [Paracrocinitomix mangrovi]|uniref:type IX secretion system ring protein PorN/GldN n=1 Tax=Paracrocinitomix mangrovi TaxID=2862509 RepID=UPI001C8EB9CE|nr:gliding motility protein GldN [Paracrocinitomix mangrovi]UKN03269.1 gliding motility protein GldN [Paracrocinitomix mangrovi]